MKNISIVIIVATLLNLSCKSGADQKGAKALNPEQDSLVKSGTNDTSLDRSKPLDVAAILQQKQIPILCYHQIRDYRSSDSKVAKDYIVPPAVFAAQMKSLADSGYTTVLPDDLYDHLAFGRDLPAKSVMITFDDTDLEQYTEAWPILQKYNYKAVFFIMTVSIGRPNYMTREQILDLHKKGNVIGSHTWDHHNVKKYAGEDWVTQIEKPAKQLKDITGVEPVYFAYPFGLWNKEAFPELRKRGVKAAFQLSIARDSTDPLFTIRRIIVPGSWPEGTLLKRMRGSFSN